jgi:hypothetical protein
LEEACKAEEDVQPQLQLQSAFVAGRMARNQRLVGDPDSLGVLLFVQEPEMKGRRQDPGPSAAAVGVLLFRDCL